MEQHELWQVEVAGNIYETDFAGLTQWIAESSLLPEDKIKCGSRPWVQARLVPALAPYFGGQAPMVSENFATTSGNFDSAHAAENTVVNEEATVNFGGTVPHTSTGFAPFENEPAEPVKTEPAKTEVVPPSAPIGQFTGATSNNGKGCALHPMREAAFACRQCLGLFCSECPRSMAKVRICPLCGDMCNPFGTAQTPAVTKTGTGSSYHSRSANSGGGPYVDPNFSFADFGAACSYPFKFPLGLIFGAIITALLGIGIYLGMITTAFGGLFPGLMTMLVCSVLMAAIVYGSATKAVNQVAYGNMKDSFMPDTEDFSIWNTILLPCFLGLGTCIVSWGPMVVVGIIIFRTILGGGGIEPAKNIKVTGQTPQTIAVPNQGFGTKDPLQKEIEGNSRESEANAIKRIQDLQRTGATSPLGGLSPASQAAQADQKSQNDAAFEAAIQKMLPRLIPLILLFALAALWGVFYFPTALTVAGYTESIGSTLNPLVGFGMIRQMGANYFKAFGTYILLLVVSGIVYGILENMPIPLVSHFLANVLSFYLYIVTACIFGLALYRSHEKMGFSVAS
jgi:hypothetical protein